MFAAVSALGSVHIGAASRAPLSAEGELLLEGAHDVETIAGKASKVVFLLRHGQSNYNAGGLDKHVPGLASNYKDAPLTETGLYEALTVADKLEALLNGSRAPGTQEEEDLVALTGPGGCAYASPLTRAVQTALVALGPLFQRNSQLKLVLDPNMRESVDKLHWDSVGDSHLEEIKRKALARLEGLGDAGRGAAEAAKSVTVDASATAGQWWSDSEDSRDSLEERIETFFRTVSLSECRIAIVAGHSGLFRDTFKDLWKPGPESYIPAWYRGTSQEWLTVVSTGGAATLPADDLQSKKLANLGLAGMSLNPQPIGSSKPILSRVRLMLDTRIQELTYKECAHGMGWRLAVDGQNGKKGRQYCACRWGGVCSSPGSECQEGMSEWPYPQSENVFNKDCKSCSCVSL
jgi:broad specificity phosphatase PhoE